MSNGTHLRVVRGEPTAEELAALVTVLTARAGAASRTGGTERAPRSEWANPARSVRGPLRPGPGAWHRSGLPR